MDGIRGKHATNTSKPNESPANRKWGMPLKQQAVWVVLMVLNQRQLVGINPREVVWPDSGEMNWKPGWDQGRASGYSHLRLDAIYPSLRPDTDAEKYWALNQKGRYCRPGSGEQDIWGPSIVQRAPNSKNHQIRPSDPLSQLPSLRDQLLLLPPSSHLNIDLACLNSSWVTAGPALPGIRLPLLPGT